MVFARHDEEQYIAVLEEQLRREAQRKFHRIYPDEDVLRPDGSILIHAREKYRGQLEFFRASATHREVAMMAANRIGKTQAGAYAVTCHLTGLYPDWWPGKRFAEPGRWWAAGKTNETTRDAVQKALLGELVGEGHAKGIDGTGMIPGRLLGKPRWKQGLPDLVDTIRVRHVTGGWATLGIKSYQQGRDAFEATAQQGVWLDEEPPLAIYEECVTRTATTNGTVLLTFTPLEGISETVMQFLPTNYFEKAD